MATITSRGKETQFSLDEIDRDKLCLQGALEMVERGHHYRITSPIIPSASSKSEDQIREELREECKAGIRLTIEESAKKVADIKERAKVKIAEYKAALEENKGILINVGKTSDDLLLETADLKEQLKAYDETSVHQDDYDSDIKDVQEKLELQVAEYELLSENSESKVRELESIIGDHENTIDVKDNAIVTLEELVDKKNEAIRDLESTIEELEE